MSFLLKEHKVSHSQEVLCEEEYITATGVGTICTQHHQSLTRRYISNPTAL